jgi:hypothetical protein
MGHWKLKRTHTTISMCIHFHYLVNMNMLQSMSQYVCSLPACAEKAQASNERGIHGTGLVICKRSLNSAQMGKSHSQNCVITLVLSKHSLLMPFKSLPPLPEKTGGHVPRPGHFCRTIRRLGGHDKVALERPKYSAWKGMGIAIVCYDRYSNATLG